MSAKHTPGPWRVIPRRICEDGSVYPRHIIGGVTEMEVCLLESPSVAELKQKDPVWSRMSEGQFAEANARLIAAAPELLAALQELVGYDSHQTEYDGRVVTLCPSCGEQDGEHRANCDFVRAHAAIAKATGSAS